MATDRITSTFLLIICLSFGACNQKTKTGEGPKPLAPQQALQSFRLSEDFRLELFLSEPQTLSPVEMVFDEDGRIYIAEMLDYPDDPPPGKPARSRIRLLEDNDGDGQYEKAVVFADQVLQVSGLLPWKGGVLVTSAPDILWMKDNDGDGKAEVRKILYTGFPKVNPENRITNLRYGIDNWVYAANHANDGRITSPDHPEHPPVLIRGADFRFDPVSGAFEASSGAAQFGLSFDDWGNQFITQNTIHLRHVVLPMRYIARAPLLEVPAYAEDISDHGKPSARMYPLTEPQEWRRQRTELRQQRYNEQGLNRVEQLTGYFTGASGGTVYTGDAWPAEYRGNVFTGDVAGNLVHRDVITPDGVTFRASRAKDGVEFIASTDQWSRPCHFANAPDGNLYMLDVYRLFIETPESIPEAIKKGMDFYAGDTMGRIYRIVSNKSPKQRSLKPNLGKASVAELVGNLESANGWHRNTAQRLIVERQDKAAIPLLRELAEKSAEPQGRLHALWTLGGLGALDEPLVLQGMKDSDAHIREHSLRLAEKLIAQSKSVQQAVLAMTADTDARVQFQLAFTLGELQDKRAFEALAGMAVERSGDQWFRLAILSSVADRAAQFFQLLRKKHPGFFSGELFAQLGALAGAKHDPAEIAGFIRSLDGLKQPEAALNGLAKGLNLAGVKNLQSYNIEAALNPYLNSASEVVQKAAWETARFFELRGLIEQALKDLTGTDLSVKQKISAVRVLRGGRFVVVAPTLQKMLAANEPGEIKIAAIESLASFDDPAIASMLLASWQSYTPDVRLKVLEALLSERERMKSLLRALEENKIERAAFGEEMRTRLLDHPDRETAERAKQIFSQETGDRMKIVESYRNALEMEGDVARGKQIFETHCAKCHVPQRQFGRIGPDLSGINNKTKEELLTSILNPGYAIEPRFLNYIVTTKDGRIRNGILANETPGAVTLRGLDGETTILRARVAEMKSSNLSLMPGAFEMLIDRQGMADLIAYLRGGL
jgi:putative membrane-bound dehydrogenase-like protein